jgi:hypothetical protein
LKVKVETPLRTLLRNINSLIIPTLHPVFKITSDQATTHGLPISYPRLLPNMAEFQSERAANHEASKHHPLWMKGDGTTRALSCCFAVCFDVPSLNAELSSFLSTQT